MFMSQRDLDIESIHNLYKDLHGVRPRHLDLGVMSDTELQERVKALGMERNQRYMDAANSFRRAIDRCIAAGATGERQAFQWLRDTSPRYEHDLGAMEFDYGLPNNFLQTYL